LPQLVHHARDHGGQTLVKPRRDYAHRRVLHEIAEQRLPHRQRLHVRQVARFQTRDGKRIGETRILVRKCICIDQRFELGRCLAFIFGAFAANASGGRHRVEQPTAGTRQRTIDSAL